MDTKPVSQVESALVDTLVVSLPATELGHREFTVVRWGPQAPDHRLDRARREGAARLVVIAEGSLPPTLPTDCLEEWVWDPATAIEIANRVALLRLRVAEHARGPSVRADGHVSYHGHSSAADPDDAAVLACLAAAYELPVPEAELIAALPDEAERPTFALRATITRLRRRLRGLGLQIERVPNTGYRLHGE